MQREKHKSGLRKQLVLFTTVLAVITYTTSAIFIYIVYPLVKESLPFGEATFNIGTLLLGVIWSGILAFFAAGFIIKPLQRLKMAALEAAQGDISQDIELPKSDNEIRSLGVAFNGMLASLRNMVKIIDENVTETNNIVDCYLK